jgi:3'-phosphoadenosine 5'-phosphosulfate sulfotransferase (PAPS reductase)/FAD synthetase
VGWAVGGGAGGGAAGGEGGAGDMNPYLVHGPAVVSFSGGRTSGFMLRQVLDAHGGVLPEDVRIVFANTGLEHAGTLEFVRDTEERWGHRVWWVEYRRGGYAVVDFASASRKGEPYEALLLDKSYLPNPVTRFCTTELKIRVMKKLAMEWGWQEWSNVIGLRADEPRRVARIKESTSRERWEVEAPIAAAGHMLADVLAFWSAQPFDLQLPNNDNAFGNCVGCFLKSAHRLARVGEHDPAALQWWADQEARAGKTFRIDRPSYSAMLTQITIQGRLFGSPEEEDTLPCVCTE